MLFATLAPALAFVPAAFAAISITGPSGSAYCNVINWTFEQGDPNPASIIVTNSNNTFLNGAFSIAEFLDLSNKTFTVTNVTLRVADGYTVSLVNPQNQSEVFASSSTFSVRAPGTPPAASSSSESPTSTGSGSAAPTSTSPSGTSSSDASPTSGSNNSAAVSTFGAQGVLALIATCGIASLSAVLL
ncbi:unnamed protein product [Somion occarium]|uniref:Yeast cell wall synthesis Kre9/Knh1-like N-terminal domain-containing protein n=1 Tax=Somion occarium TaxID=3059160 RepID=A0ABP1CUQ5_9APHY